MRSAAAAIRSHVLENLGSYLEEFEARCTAAGGTVHWASDAAEARAIILDLLRREQASEVIKIKTMTSAEIQLNPALEAAGIHAYETDLAELILQLGEDEPSHIVVPALHVNRNQVREIFARRMGLEDLPDDPRALTAAARTYLRQKFLAIPTAISGANFLIAETGSVAVVESEGNGRMCLTLPRALITLAGIEKVLPGFRFHDLRHCAITSLAESGASDSTIMAITGRVSRRMLERYSHVRIEAKRKAVESLSKGTGMGGMTQTMTQIIGEWPFGLSNLLINMVGTTGFEPATSSVSKQQHLLLSITYRNQKDI